MVDISPLLQWSILDSWEILVRSRQHHRLWRLPHRRRGLVPGEIFPYRIPQVHSGIGYAHKRPGDVDPDSCSEGVGEISRGKKVTMLCDNLSLMVVVCKWGEPETHSHRLAWGNLLSCKQGGNVRSKRGGGDRLLDLCSLDGIWTPSTVRNFSFHAGLRHDSL